MPAQESWLENIAAARDDIGRLSTADRVAHLLREQITDGRLAPGDRVPEEELGRAAKVSRNTIREAFRLLINERLLVHEFNRGVFVRKPMAPTLDRCIRISVGRPEEIAIFAEELPGALRVAG